MRFYLLNLGFVASSNLAHSAEMEQASPSKPVVLSVIERKENVGGYKAGCRVLEKSTSEISFLPFVYLLSPLGYISSLKESGNPKKLRRLAC